MSPLSKLQPVDETVASIATAIGAVAEEQRATTDKIVTLREERAAILVTGTIRSVVAVEAAMREGEIQLERLALVAADLEQRRAAAHVIERDTALETRRQATIVKIDAANLWWTAEYPRLAAAIAHGLRQCHAAEYAAWEFHHAIGVRQPNDPLIERSLPTPPRTKFAPYGPVAPHLCTQLPPTATGATTWWPTELVGRLTRADIENAVRGVPESRAQGSTSPASISALGQAEDVRDVDIAKPAAKKSDTAAVAVVLPSTLPEVSRFAHFADVRVDPNAKIDPALKNSKFAHFAGLRADPEAQKKAAAAARLIAAARARQ